MTRPAPTRRRRPRRSAFILAMALITLTVVASLLVSMVSRALADRRQLRAERNLMQTELLVDAALRRAEARLAATSDYEGETWELSSDEVVGQGPARIVIAVERGASPDDAPHIHVAAEYPLGNPTSVRRTRDVTLQPQSQLDQE
jgi:Tfp pilus assembly protein PilX